MKAKLKECKDRISESKGFDKDILKEYYITLLEKEVKRLKKKNKILKTCIRISRLTQLP